MKVSLNSIRGMNQRYQTAEDVTAIGVEALVERIGEQLGAVEAIEPIGEKYQGIIIARVIDCQPHSDSDHLKVCKIDDGRKAAGVARDGDGLVQVVCGAPNVRAGLLVAWLPPGSTVPETVGKEPFVLAARELRGVVSNGMLASVRELALGDDHDGILEIDDPANALQPGGDFAEVFELKDDVVLDIENKMFTHRPDCFGFLGISRELAGIQNLPFTSPDWYRLEVVFPAIEGEVLPLTVKNEIPALVPRFSAITMANVKLGPSPLWLRIELAKVGMRSINTIVDYTNFFMLETGQPLHAYDYDKVRALDGAETATIVVRQPRDNERITLLNGKTLDPRQEAIMIATENQLIGVGGVMGGADTEVDDNTRNIILEAACFDMYSIRRTSMAHGLFTDAVTRFNKGQSPLQTTAVLAKIVDEIRRFASGTVASELVDITAQPDRQWVHPPIPIDRSFVNLRLGADLAADDMKRLLENVEFQVAIDSDMLTVTAPFWRTDIETREDVVEEVGRLYGFDKLPLELPRRTISPVEKDATLQGKQVIRTQLAKAGANEVLTYSFVHGDLLQKVGQDPAEAYQISNALSPDLQYYRLSMTPNLLEKIHPNVKAGYDQFALFEIGKVHGQSEVDDAGLPKELQRIALVLVAAAKPAATAFAGAPYYQAQLYARQLLEPFASQPLRLTPLSDDSFETHKLFQQMVAPFDPERSALVFLGEQLAGVVGEYRAAVRRALKLPDFCAGFELFLSPFMTAAKLPYQPLSRFPKVTQDMTLKVGPDVSFQMLHDSLQQALQVSETATGTGRLHLTLVDMYQPADSDSRQITFRVVVTDSERTLTDAEVNLMLDGLAASAGQAVGAETGLALMQGWVPFGDYQLSVEYRLAPHIIIFSHGFGVGRDSRGLFSEITAALPADFGFVLFDYNDIDETHNLIHVNGFDDQVRRLQAIVDWVGVQAGVTAISLIGHSLGCLTIADLAPPDIDTMILLAPPMQMRAEARRDRYTAVAGAQLVRSVWRIPRKSGAVMLLPDAVFDELEHVDAAGELVKLALLRSFHLLVAEADDFLPDDDYTELIVMDTIESHGVPGADHNFSGPARPELLRVINGILLH